ncbi:hypothetical protein [Streptomyces sp. NPDC051561]|uniref:hypothetical protein n=1 Tax=Streptomyces sp. NPDC051561 TaxID=3365658 RepID=UPI0037918938
MRVRLRSAAALLGCLLLYAAGPAPAASAEDAWTAGPASGSGTPRRPPQSVRAGEAPPAGDLRPYFYLQGAPGTVFTDKLSVTNPGREVRTVQLRTEDTEGAWIALAAAEVKVPARTRADVPFTVTVPAGAQPGDHPGMIVASTADGREQRTPVQLRVSGPTLSALSVEDVRIDGDGIRYALVNRGNTTLTPRVTVRADGVFGELLRRTAHSVRPLAPGRRAELTEPWTDPPVLDRADARLTVTAGGGIHEEAAAAAAFVPWGPVLGGGAVVLVAGAGGVLWAVRRRRGGEEGEPDVG